MKNIILIFSVFVFLGFKNQAQTVTDIDGNIYNTVAIGTQVWLKENLKTTRYIDGTVIPNVTDETIWCTFSSGVYCDYENTSSNSTTFGRLYNWYAVIDNHKICPAGWHVSSDAEWNIMEKYLDNTVDTTTIGWSGTDIGGKLKEIGTTYWSSPNIGATDSSGFSALPGGYRYVNGVFSDIGNYGYWWTTTSFDVADAWYRFLRYNSSEVYKDYYYKVDGLSVRCIRDSAVTQINDNDINKQIQIYPNPAIDKLSVDCANEKGIKIQFYNVMGDCVFHNVLNAGTNVIDLSFLTSGVYILQLIGIDATIQQKLIKN